VQRQTLLSRSSNSNVAFSIRFLPKKGRQKLEKKLSCYIQTHMDESLDHQWSGAIKKEERFDISKQIDAYFKVH